MMKIQAILPVAFAWVASLSNCNSFTIFKSNFHRRTTTLPLESAVYIRDYYDNILTESVVCMRKQKASDRRTRRRQRGETTLEEDPLSSTGRTATMTTNPMQASVWKAKAGVASSMRSSETLQRSRSTGSGGNVDGGRGRSRKRTTFYQILQHYHSSFLHPLTTEYQAEEDEVLGRIQASLEDPLGLEQAGYAVYDMYAERRGNLLGQEVYRLVKAIDATTSYDRNDETEASGQPIPAETSNPQRYLPPNHKFSNNDVIMLTEQPHGSGDFFTTATLPMSDTAIAAEAVVLNIGPTYLDISMAAGCFEATFGLPGNDMTGQGNKRLRLRVDRFISPIPYQRMVAALNQLTAIPENKKAMVPNSGGVAPKEKTSSIPAIAMDDVLKEAILQTQVFTDPASPLFGDQEVCNVEELAAKLAKPPMATSQKLCAMTLRYMQSNPAVFRDFNAPQRAAIESALTRRMTLVQGPPGTGKTCVASAIGFGFAQQCQSISPHTKVLACAFSNVGADNLADGLIQLGLKVVRIGKPSAVAESLWTFTLDAAIDRDPTAQKALQHAAYATSQLAKVNRRQKGPSNSKSSSSLSDRSIRDMATAAVKASIKASNVAATKAMREADVIVTTSIGAADARLLAACGIVTEIDETSDTSPSDRTRTRQTLDRTLAPDELPPLSLPFVIIDEACQSIEPASLIPIIASNSCRSLVLLGDPCQLPPTVKSRQATSLSLSLMERFAATLPRPTINPSQDTTEKDLSFLNSLPIKHAVSFLRSRSSTGQQRSYSNVFSGSLLLSIQYRMHPSIAALPSAIFYDGMLTTPQFLANQRTFPSTLKRLMPCDNPNQCVRLIHVGGRENERQGTPSRYTRTLFSNSTPENASSLLEQQTTYWNEPEAEHVVSLVRHLLSDKINPAINSIGIISPYNGQVQLIKMMIANDSDLRDLLGKSKVSIEIKSVDGYQGRERDVIIFSTVRSNRQDRIGFLHDWRRMNVALTRAKSALLIVGDFDTLSPSDKHWGALHQWANSARCVVDKLDFLNTPESR